MPPAPSGPLTACGDLVGVQTRARDDPLRLDRPAGRLDDEARPRSPTPDARHNRGGWSRRPSSISAASDAAHVRVVDDAGVEHVQRGDPGDVRFDLAQLLGADHLGAHAVRARSGAPARPGGAGRRRRARPRPCRTPRGRCRALGSTRTIEMRPARAQPRLLGSGLVVDAGVDHARVATALVRADRRFLLHHDDRAVGMRAHDRPRGREPDDPATHDEHVGTVHCGRTLLPGALGAPGQLRVSRRRRSRARRVRALDAALRLLPVLLAAERGLVEQVVRTADRLEPAGVHGVRVEDAVADAQEAAAARVLDRLAVLDVQRRTRAARARPWSGSCTRPARPTRRA